MRSLIQGLLALSIFFQFFSLPAQAGGAWVVNDIRIEGLQRISAGTVFNYLPVKVGHTLDDTTTGSAIRALFKTGFFKDVRLEREGNTLVVWITERPSIAMVTLKGNSSVETDALKENLKQVGFSEGRVFDRALLDRVEQELLRMYFSEGRYGARIETTVTPMERNRVGITFDISEGKVAQIKEINIVGNKAFEEDDLLELFELTTPGWLSFITKDAQYSKQKLSGDLEALRSHYLDRGFINFNIDSTQISLSADKKDVYITINITEGERFSISGVKLSGDLAVPQEELGKLITIKQGQHFSRKLVTAASTAIADRLGDDGYAFANVNAIPDINDKARAVAMTFFIDPGKRVYVRRLNFKGNSRTRDEVLHREMRQMEGGWISSNKVKRSQTRLETLGYFEEVNVETPAVPGTTDQVDVEYTVVEKPSGNLMAGVGYSQNQGVILSSSVSQQNFLGSGKQLGVSVNTGSVNQTYAFSYLNPYWTIDGVSRGFNLYKRRTNANNANVSDYSTDRWGGGMSLGIPINEFDRVRVGFELEDKSVDLGSGASRQIREFINEEGDDFLTFGVTANWSHNTRNRAIFPDRGMLTSLGGEVVTGDLEYFKVNAKHQHLFPFWDDYTLMLKGEVGYGTSFGETDRLPFFENYYAGGIRSVRGYEQNSLGGKDSNDDPIGGEYKVIGNAEVILPVPFLKKETRSIRLSAFMDVGNVFSHEETFEGDRLRGSVGLAATWISPMGAMSFSLAQPVNDKGDDDTQAFQFTLGSGF